MPSNGEPILWPEDYLPDAAHQTRSPVFERLGGRLVWQGRFELMLIGPAEERWDHCFIAEYPSVSAFVE